MASSAFQRPTFALRIGGDRIEYDMNMYDDEVEKVACVDEIVHNATTEAAATISALAAINERK